MLDKLGLIIAVLIMVGMVAVGMYPALFTNDPETVQKAADQTIERVIDFGTDRIVDEVKGLPLNIATDELLK